jgi:ABC-type dipeptide/oligopeptide/nickel transport system permease component
MIYCLLGVVPAFQAIFSTVGGEKAGASAMLGVYGFPSTLVLFVLLIPFGTPNFNLVIILSWVFVVINGWLAYRIAMRWTKEKDARD